MSNDAPLSVAAAIEDFHRARRRAALSGLFTQLTGRSNELLSYDDVVAKLRFESASQRRLEDVPLDKIVGSVGRYRDFTREFLPRDWSSNQRWAQIKKRMTGIEGVPPIDV